ncbi:MAG TPA: tol-pal system protein YbgF [Sulfuricella sp.]|nr:tol-pal system protein YbgF [Sulfuricella sp.]
MRRLALFLILFLGGVSLCSAGLFSDDEARQKIAALQQQIQGMEERVAQMENTSRSQGVGLLSQLDALKSDLATLRGQIEVQTHDIETTQKRQRDLYVDLDNRLRKLERVGGPVSETPVQANPGKQAAPDPTQVAPAAGTDTVDEPQEYDAALALFRAGNYQGAIAGFQRFISAYPNGQLAPSAHYWIGNSYFNLRDYKNAIASQQKLASQFPDSAKVPDALLNIASCQQGLGDTAAARKTLESIVAKYPLSNAAVLAKNRLAKIK